VAHNTAGNSPASAAVSTSTAIAADNIIAEGVSNSEIDLSWTVDVSSGSIEIDRSTDGTNYSAIATGLAITTSTYSDTSRTEGTHYYYLITVTTSAGYSINTTDAWTLPTAPSSLSATLSSRTQINLAWTNNSTHATGVTIYRSTDNASFDPLATVSASSSTYADTTVAEGTTYYYQICANGGGEPSANTTSATATTPSQLVTSLTATANSVQNISLAWTLSGSGITSIEVDRSTDGINFSSIATGLSATTTSYTDTSTSLADQTEYYYQIKAVDSQGTSTSAPAATQTVMITSTVVSTSENRPGLD
jgi:hypothetical protein